MQIPIDKSVESKSSRDTDGLGIHTALTTIGSVVANASLFRYAQGEPRGIAPVACIAA